MKSIITIILLSFSVSVALGQNQVIEDLQEYYNLGNGIQCSTNIKIEVPGMSIPEKEVYFELIPDEKPKVKGPGLIFLPKKGLSNHFEDILNSETHFIDMGNSGDTLLYKLVAIDPKSDWITADLYVLNGKQRIEKMKINSRENGEYSIFHTYGNENYPIQSKVYFKVDEFKLPIQLMGRTDKASGVTEGPQTGIITLTYSNFVFL